jgi:hypothetical protein
MQIGRFWRKLTHRRRRRLWLDVPMRVGYGLYHRVGNFQHTVLRALNFCSVVECGSLSPTPNVAAAQDSR